MKSRERIIKFQPGDRVAEKPKPRPILTKTRATIERIKPYTEQRYGTVLDTIYQTTRGKAVVPYVKIIWDGSQSPATHAQNRICFEEEFATLSEAYRQAIE